MRTLVCFLSAVFLFSGSLAHAKNLSKKSKRVEVVFSDSESKEGIPDLRKFSPAELSSSANPLSAAARRWLRLDDTKVESIEDEAERSPALDQDLE